MDPLPTATSLLDTSGDTNTSDDDGGSSGSSAEWESLCQAEQASAGTVLALEERNRALRQRLRQLQHQRRHVCQQQQQPCDALDQQLRRQHAAAVRAQQEALQDLLSLRQERRVRDHHWRSRQQRWNVQANDAFHIDVDVNDGCATINGLRLGAVSVVGGAGGAAVGSNSNIAGESLQSSAPANAAQNAVGAFLSFVGGGGGGQTSQSFSPNRQQQQQQQQRATGVKTVRVPWREINAALGQLALLLSVLEQSLAVPSSLDNNNINASTHNKNKTSATATTQPALFRYEIQVMGSTSTIGLRRTLGASSSTAAAANISFYNLYFSDEGFQLFGKRNFDAALQYLVDCVQSAAEIVQKQRDGSIVLPHAMECSKGSSSSSSSSLPTTIGGLPIQYFFPTSSSSNQQQQQQAAPTEEEHLLEWTRAMKYLLTNVKHLMVYRGIGLFNTK